jgi:hypothetical protein
VGLDAHSGGGGVVTVGLAARAGGWGGGVGWGGVGWGGVGWGGGWGKGGGSSRFGAGMWVAVNVVVGRVPDTLLAVKEYYNMVHVSVFGGEGWLSLQQTHDSLAWCQAQCSRRRRAL